MNKKGSTTASTWFSPSYHVSIMTKLSRLQGSTMNNYRDEHRNSHRYATRGLLGSTSFATRRIGAISARDDGTTSLSIIDSPMFPIVCVRVIRRWSDGSGPPLDAIIINFHTFISSLKKSEYKFHCASTLASGK